MRLYRARNNFLCLNTILTATSPKYGVLKTHTLTWKISVTDPRSMRSVPFHSKRSMTCCLALLIRIYGIFGYINVNPVRIIISIMSPEVSGRTVVDATTQRSTRFHFQHEGHPIMRFATVLRETTTTLDKACLLTG